jgi:2-polyprenyl-6-methoxyphenol hydroxylase-like FAD-dependent oxidoreductase
MPGALRALQRLGLDPPGHDIRGIVYRQGDAVARARFGGDVGRGVRRTDLHQGLRAAIDALGVPVLDHRITDVVQHEDHVSAGGLRARYLVAADGLHSPIRRAAGLARGSGDHRTPPRWGVRQHFAVAPFSDSVEVTWAGRSEAYVTPVGPDLIGVAVLSSTRGGFDDQLAAFPELAARRVLLVGDAAGYIDALTGEGLALAFATADVLVQCLVQDRPERYERAARRLSRRSRWITSTLLRARTDERLSDRVVPLAARAPRLFSLAVRQLAR